jgi:predicted DCC family thiol-disulfide oxidoreductase YuxK
MNLSVFNALCYTVGWFWCLFCGLYGHSILGAIGAIFLIFIQLYYAKLKNLSLYIQDLILVILSVPLGLLLEIFFIQIHLIHYVNHTRFYPPIWIVLIYPLFTLIVNHSLKIIKKNYLYSFLFGFLGAPPSYISGASLRLLTFSYPFILTWILLGVSWGLFLCLLSKIAKMVEKATVETFEDCDSKLVVELLYDGDCPICKQEICFLQRKNQQTHVKFINIASKDFSAVEHKDIDYETAMSQIHAIDGKGNLLVGLPAFAAVYARCQLFLLSTLLRLSFIRIVLNPFYKLFAKKRLWITGRTGRRI